MTGRSSHGCKILETFSFSGSTFYCSSYRHNRHWANLVPRAFPGTRLAWGLINSVHQVHWCIGKSKLKIFQLFTTKLNQKRPLLVNVIILSFKRGKEKKKTKREPSSVFKVRRYFMHNYYWSVLVYGQLVTSEIATNELLWNNWHSLIPRITYLRFLLSRQAYSNLKSTQIQICRPCVINLVFIY